MSVFKVKFDLKTDLTLDITRLGDASLTVFSLAVFITVQSTAMAGDSLKDSSQTSVAQKRANMRITARIHSVGLFGFAGLIANENPAMDVAFNYERKYWNAMIVKAVDLYDIRSPYDFTLALIYTHLAVGRRLTISPYAGCVLEQTHQFAGAGSDGMALIMTTYRINRNFSFEHTGRFSNLMLDNESFDWLNRMRLSWSKDHLDIVATCWRNNRVFDETSYTTWGMSAAYNRIEVARNVTMSAGITAVFTMDTSGIELTGKTNGLLLTIATMID